MPNAQKVLSMLDRPWRRRGQLCVWLQPYALSSGAEALGASLSQSERAISFRNAIHEWLCAIPAGGCLRTDTKQITLKQERLIRQDTLHDG
jgi:hypothetical protein